MAGLNPVREFEDLKKRVVEALQSQFPFVGSKHRLELEKIEVVDSDAPDSEYHVDNLGAQQEAKLAGRSWEVPVRASLKLVDIESGKVLSRTTMALAKIPKLTRRYSYIIDGHERQHDSVFRLRPRPYHIIADNGDIKAKWNLAGGMSFDLDIDRQSGAISMHLGSSNIPIYSILKALNVPDAQMRESWGKEVFEANQKKAKPNDIYKAWKVIKKPKKGEVEPSVPDAEKVVREYFLNRTSLRPDAMVAAFGKPYTHVNGENLLLSSKRVLGISRGTEEEDDRQSLASKDLASTGDFIVEAVQSRSKDIQARILDNLDKKTEVRGIISPYEYTSVIRNTFTYSQRPEQTNPLDFISGYLKTTIRGPDFGGIAAEKANLDPDKRINPSHLGFLDVVQTPEGDETGITLHLPLGVEKEGKDLKTSVYDKRTGTWVKVTPAEMERAVVAFPDQVTWANGKPSPIADVVAVYDSDKKTAQRPWKDVDLVMPSAKATFSFSTNLIPFLQNNNGNRAMMAAKQQEQAVSLKYREAPLVQTKSDTPLTFEEILGGVNAHLAPIGGTVEEVTPERIVIKADDGKTATVHLYDHFPLNGGKNMLHAYPKVKVGDKVHKQELLADTNYTKNGRLALGTNMRVAYLPYRGLNFEDGIVVSESAAKKMTSEHLHAETLQVFPGMIISRSRWPDYAVPERATSDRLSKLDPSGIIKVGQKVTKGDVLVAALAPMAGFSKDSEDLRAIKKSLVKDFRDRALIWDLDYPGTVAKIVNGNNQITVYVHTEEPLTVGDKLAGRHGNKGIVSRVIPDHEMPKDKDGHPVEILLSPAGVPSRKNIGQVLETAASKIAKKTGHVYITENFVPGKDYSQEVKDQLAKHGISDTEELFDPETGRSLGPIMVGNQYMLKLHHQVDKKMTARSYGTGYSVHGQAPRGSGVPGGGQKLDQMTVYALLSHGAEHNLRESFTFKSDADQDDVWYALMAGQELPDPRPSRSMNNLVSYMKAMGIHVDKQGDQYVMSPMTDKQTKAVSNGEIRFPSKTLHARGLRTIEEAGGLFDPTITGTRFTENGLEGEYWGHITLQKRMPNPMFETPIRMLLGIKEAEFEKLVGPEPVDGKSGFDIIADRLAGINVDAALKEAENRLGKLSGTPLDREYRKVRYLRALKKLNISPLDAYTNLAIPVVPPAIRQVKVDPRGKLIFDDLNNLYRAVGQANDAIKDGEKAGQGAAEMQRRYSTLYDMVRGLRVSGLDLGGAGQKRHHKGLMEKLEGDKPKTCYDEATEILSEDGWVPFRALRVGAQVATVSMESGEFQWQVPSRYVAEPHVGPMISIQKRDIDLLTTTNHDHVVQRTVQRGGRRHWTGVWEKEKAETFVGRTARRRFMASATTWKGALPAYSFDDVAVEPHALAWLTGLWVAEGWIADERYACVELASETSALLCAEVDRAVAKLGAVRVRKDEYVKTYEGRPYPTTRWTFYGELAAWLATNCGVGSENKKLSPEILSWDRASLRLLLDAYLAGDGGTRLAGKQRGTYVRRDKIADKGSLRTTSSALMDDLQHLAAKVGLRVISRGTRKIGDKKPQYEGGLLGFSDVSMEDPKSVSVVQYDGMVYCVEVPNGTLVIRRNGIPMVSGNSFFQDQVMSRRQDLSARSTIVPEPNMGLDEVGVPQPVAFEMFKPFIVRDLRQTFAVRGPDALKMHREKHPLAIEALHRVAEQRPVLMKRDPALHQFSIMAFRPKIIGGKAIALHPLVTGGFNADFDGDTMALFAPVHDLAVAEARKMMPSQKLFSPTTGGLMPVPSQDSLLGLYQVTGWEKDEGKSLSREDAVRKVKAGSLPPNEVITVDGKKTTAGRLMLADSLPQAMKDDAELLYDKTFRLDKGRLRKFLTRVARGYPNEFARTVDAWKDHGNRLSYLHGSSFSLNDFHDGRQVRDRVLAPYKAEEAKIRSSGLSRKQKDDKIVELYGKALEDLKMHGTSAYRASNNKMYEWAASGARGGWDDFAQLVIGPVLVSGSEGETVPLPITRSFGEGLSFSEYMASMHGARKGTLDRASGTREPGALTKKITNTVIDMKITAEDCGTTDGVFIDTKADDIVDRYTAKPITLKDGTVLPPKTLMTPELRSRLVTEGITKVVMRSPLRCKMPTGICATCFGLSEVGKLHAVGTNIGTITGQSLGEPVTQLTMRTFHTGGAVGTGGGTVVDAFRRVEDLLMLPKKLAGAATLAKVDGDVTKFEKNTSQGGWDVYIGTTRHYIPAGLAPLPEIRMGMTVKKGDAISTGPKNPHEMLKYTGNLNAVRSYIADSLDQAYNEKGRLTGRRNIDTVVRAATNLTMIEDPKGHPQYLRGQYAPLSEVEHLNEEARAKGMPEIEHKPQLKGLGMMPLSGREDWMGRLNFERLEKTFLEGGAQGWSSDIHGSQIAGIAHGAELGVPKRSGIAAAMAAAK